MSSLASFFNIFIFQKSIPTVVLHARGGLEDPSIARGSETAQTPVCVPQPPSTHAWAPPGGSWDATLALGTTLLQNAAIGNMKSDVTERISSLDSKFTVIEAFMESLINSDYFSGPDLWAFCFNYCNFVIQFFCLQLLCFAALVFSRINSIDTIMLSFIWQVGSNKDASEGSYKDWITDSDLFAGCWVVSQSNVFSGVLVSLDQKRARRPKRKKKTAQEGKRPKTAQGAKTPKGRKGQKWQRAKRQKTPQGQKTAKGKKAKNGKGHKRQRGEKGKRQQRAKKAKTAKSKKGQRAKKQKRQKNKAVYTTASVAYGWAGAVTEVKAPFGVFSASDFLSKRITCINLTKNSKFDHCFFWLIWSSKKFYIFNDFSW